MSKAVKPSGRSARQVRGGGAGRSPGDDKALRPTPRGLFSLFPGAMKPPENVHARGKGGRGSKNRGDGRASDSNRPYTDPYL